jgi:DNA (cytosine-5)-methyltransferase 1
MRMLSLFSGGGGLDMAAETLWPDLRHAAFSEIDPHAVAVYERWRPDVPNLGDLNSINWTFAEIAGALGPVDVITAGFPCQDISHAGKRAGIKEGTRSGLWFRVADAVRVLRPRVVLLENVAAIASPGGGLDVVLGSLAEVGFDAEWGVLRASDVGAPHGRARWFCVAYPGGQLGAGDGEAFAGDGVSAPGRAAETEPRRRGGLAADSSLDRRAEGRTGPGERTWSPRQPACHRGALTDACGTGWEREGPDPRGGSVPTGVHVSLGRWGDYSAAVARWERLLGRGAPDPTDARGRLSPPFVEWLMGWPQGHVDGLSRSQALKVLGNGVVPQQAVHAYRQLLARIPTMEAAA